MHIDTRKEHGLRCVLSGVHLVFAGQPELVAKAVLGDVLYVGFCKLVNGCIDDINAPVLSHALCGVIGVRPSAWNRSNVKTSSCNRLEKQFCKPACSSKGNGLLAREGLEAVV